MTEQLPLSFEVLRDTIATMPATSDSTSRTLVWADPARTIAFARDRRQRLELFLVGEAFEASDPLVGEHLQHDTWTTSSGEPLPASRLVLPRDDHFNSIAAFICARLVENGYEKDHAVAFRRSEPVIALALRRAGLGNQALVGLAGELYVLARLVEAWPDRASCVVSDWFGSRPSSRDLQLGPVGIEIKTTTQSESVHHIQGPHQVELGISVDDEPETNLFLLSVGLEWLPFDATVGRSIPALVDVILFALPESEERDEFLARVKGYGGDPASGYDHSANRASARYGRPFVTRFERLYDMSDDRIRVLRQSDLADKTHVEAGSVSYRVRFPSQVRGDLNPVAGMAAILAKLDSMVG